jgi:hypothetical protein
VHRRLTRQQLHALAWERPITHLAREFGLSDVALHKICRKNGVPTPLPGYWAKKAAGKAPKTAPLPDPADSSEILIRESGASNESEAMGEARAAVFVALQASDRPTGNSNDPIVERTLAKLSAAKPRADGLVHATGRALVDVVVRPQSIERVKELLPELVAKAARADIKLVRGEAGARWLCDGETIAFELVEAADKIEHVATEKELAAVAKWKRERDERHRRYGYWDNWGEPKIPKWEERYQGRLMVRLENVPLKSERSPWGEPMRHAFAETRTRRLEKSIPAILSTVAAMAEAKRSNAEFEEREREAAAVRARRYAEEERRRIAEAHAIRLLDQLIEEQSLIGRLSALIEPLMSQKLGSRGARLLEWARERLEAMEQQLSSGALEKRLGDADLFGSNDPNSEP